MIRHLFQRKPDARDAYAIAAAMVVQLLEHPEDAENIAVFHLTNRPDAVAILSYALGYQTHLAIALRNASPEGLVEAERQLDLIRTEAMSI